MQRSFPFGTAYGFVLILSYSRYLYCRFYPRQSMEFFWKGISKLSGRSAAFPAAAVMTISKAL